MRRGFELTIMRAGVQEDLTGCTVMCKFYRMADSTVVSMTGSVEDRKAVAVLNKACYDYIGRFALTIAIKNGEEETTVFYGDGYMHGQRADTSISGEYIIYDINTLLEKIAEIDASTQAANTATSNANTAIENANTATGKANTAANAANTAATNANTAKDAANAAAGKINNMTVSATPVSTGTATAELSMVDGHYHLALGLPKGDTGATPQINVQVATGAAGSEAQVSVSGTAENPVIHLTIPRGDTGAIENLTINGKPVESGTITLTSADVGALPSGGTAADSSKLGGKAPEYYLQPRNLLDNSDFTRFVAQAGIMGTHGAVPYAGDRWSMGGGTVTGVANAYDDGYTDITLQTNSRFEQVVAGIDKYYGQPMTAALWLKNGSVIVGSAIVNAPTEDYLTPISVGNDNTNIYLQATTGDARVYIFIIATYGNSETVVAAALLPGSYTAETLPPYVPKGYAAELASCNSAPVDVGGGYGGGSLQAYPVGSIYMSVNSTSPASLFGGTWEQLKDRFLLAAGSTYSAGSTGGEAEHSLIANELPKIEGWIEAGAGSSGTPTSSGHGAFRSASGVFSTTRNCNYSYDNSDKAIWTPTDTDSWQQVNMSFGNDQPHNNMPPYLAVYMWKRVS